MKIALGQINPTVGDFTGNSNKIIEYSRKAQAAGADLIIFSEMSVCGYPARDMVERPAFVERSRETVEHIAKQVPGIAVIVGFVTPAHADTGKSVMNSAALLAGGELRFLQSKMLLPTYDVFDEQRNFAPAKAQELLRFGDRELALTICEDAWNDKHFWPRRLYPVDPVDELLKRGANMVVNISASPYVIGKQQVREKMLAAVATGDKVPVVLVNQVGGNDSVIFDGASMVVAPDGRVVVRAKSFEEDLVFFDSSSLTGDLRPLLEDWEQGAYAALVLGTRDYLHKCGFTKAVIGLSGGIDSALVAAIAVDALGSDNVTSIGMPSPYSSKGSVDDSSELAKNLGIKFHVVPITNLFQEFRNALQPVFQGKAEDLTEENMQARVRGNILMAYANKFHAMTLITSNKSEMAVGYGTLYGDMAGALGVIADVPKTMVYKLCRYLNARKPAIPQSILEKEPSAELRPGQKDTDSLPPYEVLDQVLEDYVEDLKTVKQIAAERNLDKELVLKIVRMIERSEYKRQQIPPGLKITEKAFGVGRRFPIAARYEV